MIINYPRYFGQFDTKTFADVFPSPSAFEESMKASGLPISFTKTETVTTIYLLLYSRYGNAHIATTDENQFKVQIFSTVFQYGLAWEKRLEIQDRLYKLQEGQILQGGRAIYNKALNPSVAPGTASLEELQYINEQNTTNYKKNVLEAYAELASILDDSFTASFLDQFAPWFIAIMAPTSPLLYSTPEGFGED